MPTDLDVDRLLIPMTCRAGDTVLDCGLFRGATVELFLGCGARRVHGFEPNRASFAELQARFGVDPRVRLYNAALADRGGTASLHVPDHNSGAASIIADYATSYAGHRGTALSADEVATAAIDELDLPDCDYWKVDVEGAEELLFAGAERTLARRKPRFLQVEIFGPPYNPPTYRLNLLRRLETLLGCRGSILAADQGSRLVRLSYSFFFRPLDDDVQRRVSAAIWRVGTPVFVYWPQGGDPEVPEVPLSEIR